MSEYEKVDAPPLRQRPTPAPLPWEHGTRSGYGEHGCRCRPCTDAFVAYQRQLLAGERAVAEAGAPMATEHGVQGYKYHCKCYICKAAHAAEQQVRRQQLYAERANGVPLPEGVEHGINTYNYYGCRCQVCTDDKNTYQREYRARKAARIVHPGDAENRVVRTREVERLPVPVPPCGTTAKYDRGCRCDPCRQVRRVYDRERYESGKRKVTCVGCIGAECPTCGGSGKLVAHDQYSRRQPVRCGTETAYGKGCRCDACREVFNRRQRERYHARKKAS